MKKILILIFTCLLSVEGDKNKIIDEFKKRHNINVIGDPDNYCDHTKQ